MVVNFDGSLGLLLLLSPLLTSADPVHPNIVARAAPAKYFAQGDSYGSGIAAGTYVNLEIGSMDWFCSRFTQAYGRQLNGLLGGSADFQHQACSGQNALQVQTTQEIDSDADLVTLTVGGNDANFGDIVDKCVYGFTTTGDTIDRCNAATAATQNNIANSVWNPVWNTVWNILHTATKPTFQLYVTNYPRFWNENTTQCDSVSFDWYAGPDGPNKMTQALRQSMNDLSTQLNNQLASVVQNFHNNGENRVQLVDIDLVFQGHRFCEDGVDEPQQSGNENSNTWIFQWNTPIGSINSTIGPSSDVAAWFQSIKQAANGNPPSIQNSFYSSQPIDPNQDFGSSGGLPLPLSKLFHPTSPGHAAIAGAINGLIGQANSAPPPSSPPAAAPPPATSAAATPSCEFGNCQCTDGPLPKCKCQCLCGGKVAPDSSC